MSRTLEVFEHGKLCVTETGHGIRPNELEALIRSVQSTFEVYVKLNKKVQPEVLMSVQSIDDPSKLSDTIAANLPTIKLADRQGLFEMEEPKKRLERLYELMQAEISHLCLQDRHAGTRFPSATGGLHASHRLYHHQRRKLEQPERIGYLRA